MYIYIYIYIERDIQIDTEREILLVQRLPTGRKARAREESYEATLAGKKNMVGYE